ncbi:MULTISPECIES: DUF4383 domain-containing protein [unclassified Arthrobacter]|uniref:DUF4383 domain-containing protein n=1 Tax=unclassified Arthrobacter TaxID=235627 RepID=UPI001D1473AC|nr:MULTISPECIES: DUF4383 domain-containing protein [unclassified Arthrobacter]MCC3275652.1 DUF4383 domain-containing protein [Arthrobacter sp. zg-Y20]MCC9177092.1 DUF4383 domain-containing protein [Arthrobacter sp. zg-Y750]MDK1315809.1 DUF4383 domain-containing protein [Arthrobacter sp. zg.Y20]WIB06210.1 DUF4383 domain-containing protein [Arthrobacter sp. zg-Y20]
MAYPSYSSGGGLSARRTSAQKAAIAFGIVFLLIGVLGFIPGLTANYSQLYFSGYTSEATLLGIFQVSVLHNVVHMLLGFAGLAMARSNSSAKLYLVGAGILYALLFIYGLLVPFDTSANFVPLNTADNWLHVILAVLMILLGIFLGRRTDNRTYRSSGNPGEGSIPN